MELKWSLKGKKKYSIEKWFCDGCESSEFFRYKCRFAGVSHTAFLAKADLWKIPYFGWGLSKTGSIPIYRKDPKKNAGMGKIIKQRIDQGYNYCVFPEGNRTKDGKMTYLKTAFLE